MAWKLAYSPGGQRDLEKLDQAVELAVVRKLEWLRDTFDMMYRTQLHGELAEHQKLRVGDYRVAYTTDHRAHTIYVDRIRHRDKAYKPKARD